MFKLLIIIIGGLSSVLYIPLRIDSMNRDDSNTSVITYNHITDTAGNNAALQDVLFATNEDCDLYINGAFKTRVTKDAHKYVKLLPGKHTYTAKSKTITDVLEQTFNVGEKQANEVFIDFLYFLDERKTARDNLKGKKNAASVAKPGGVSNPISTVSGITTSTKYETEKLVIDALASDMISISGGSFIMGNNKSPSVDETEHTVTISSIRFSKYEVTQKQWESIMGYNPSENKGCSNCPVENVSWEEVIKFIKKLNVAGNKKFRLPTEAEWEYVARMGGKEEIEKAGGIESYIKNSAWYFGNADKKTHPVGMKQPTGTDIYDLLGNVSEWCSDWYSATYFKESSNEKDPEGPPLGKEKVIRGGNFEDYTGDRFRPSLRGKFKPTSKSKLIGFRLVLEN
jgi:formylglycine-generating enzyme required for sulfatase activity